MPVNAFLHSTQFLIGEIEMKFGEGFDVKPFANFEILKKKNDRVEAPVSTLCPVGLYFFAFQSIPSLSFFFFQCIPSFS